MSHRFISLSGSASASAGVASLATSLDWIDLSTLATVSSVLKSAVASGVSSIASALEKQAASTNTLSRFETEVLVTEDNLKGLGRLNAKWVDHAMTRTRHQRIILDMDSSESPVYGEQEGATYNGHLGCVCYHPLFCFNQFGNCEGAVLRPGNVYSAEG